MCPTIRHPENSKIMKKIKKISVAVDWRGDDISR